MEDQNFTDAYYRLGRLSSQAMDEKKYHDALQYAIAAYLITKDVDRDGINVNTVILMLSSCEKILSLRTKIPTNQSKKPLLKDSACSFCSNKEPKIELTAGLHGVFICNLCAKSISECSHKGK